MGQQLAQRGRRAAGRDAGDQPPVADADSTSAGAAAAVTTAIAYKRLSVVDGGSGLVVGDRYVSEKRPDQRSRAEPVLAEQAAPEAGRGGLLLPLLRRQTGACAPTRWTCATALNWAAACTWNRTGGCTARARPTSRAAGWWKASDWNSAPTAPVAQASADPRLAAFTAQTLGPNSACRWARQANSRCVPSCTARCPSGRRAHPACCQTLDLTPTLKATTLLRGLFSCAF
jgi:hypothetical protein